MFAYDLAVAPEYRRQGIGQQLVRALRSRVAEADISVVFVPADTEDSRAIAFYRGVGGRPDAATIFTFSERRADDAAAIGGQVLSVSASRPTADRS